MDYSDEVLDHCENPRNVGSLDPFDRHVGTALVGSPSCGDMLRLQILVDDDDTIRDAKFKTYGCGSAIASSSLATEWIIGKKLSDAATIRNQDLAGHLALPDRKAHCSVMAEDAIREAIEDFRRKQRGEAPQTGLLTPIEKPRHLQIVRG